MLLVLPQRHNTKYVVRSSFAQEPNENTRSYSGYDLDIYYTKVKNSNPTTHIYNTNNFQVY
jgi:hypothetical protein